MLRAGVQGGGGDLLELLVEALQAELAEGEFRQVFGSCDVGRGTGGLPHAGVSWR